MLLQVSDVGPWVCFPETVHELYAHLAELISNIMKSVCSILTNFLSELNENRGLKKMSEENLEVIFSYPVKCLWNWL